MRDLANEMLRLYKMHSYLMWNCVNVILNTNPADPVKYEKVMLLSEMMIRKEMKTVIVFSFYHSDGPQLARRSQSPMAAHPGASPRKQVGGGREGVGRTSRELYRLTSPNR